MSSRAGAWPEKRAIGVAVLSAGFVAAWFCPMARAGDFDDKPLGLRIGLALDRVSCFSDTIGRSASVAHPLGSSVNPASFDYLREPPFDFRVLGTLTSNFGSFDTGASVTGLSTTWAYRFPDAGTVSLNYIRTDSYDAETRQGDDVVLRSNEFTLGYSRRVQPDLSLGCSLKVTDSVLKVDDTFMGFPRDVDSSSLGVDVKAGVLKAVGERWTFGLVAGYGRTCSDIDGLVALPPIPFGPGPVTISETNRTDALNVRMGVGWRPVDPLGFYVDGQYLHLEDDFASVDVGRVLAGIEAYASPSVALRVGGTFDTERNSTFSAGIGYYGMKHMPVELAYSYNAFPEVAHEFGRAHLFSLSVVLRF